VHKIDFALTVLDEATGYLAALREKP